VWRRALSRGVPATFVALLVVSNVAAPVAPSRKPIVEAKVHAVADDAVRAGRSATVDTDLPTEAVGVDWEGTGEGAVEVRAREGKSWSAWMRIEGNPDEGPDLTSKEHRVRTGAGPVWVGHGVDKVEMRLVEGDLRGLRIHAIRSEDPPAAGGIRPAGALVSQPGIISRAQWGANESDRSFAPGCGQPEYADAVRMAFVHHTDNANNYGPGDGPALVRSIYYFHTHGQGWCDIGYNFLVDRYGQVFEGRYGGITRPVIGAHALGFNTGSTGVALIGTFQEENVPSAMYSALRSLLNWKLAYHGINPSSSVVASGRVVPALAAHRDVNNTDCPGNLAYGLLPRLRSEVASDIQGSIDKPAVIRGATFYLRNWQTTGAADGAFGFGIPSDRGMMGDWNGDGSESPGVVRNGTWYLRNSNTTGVADVVFGFGNPADKPVVGDWNADGYDSPGVVRNGAWYLRNSNTTGNAEAIVGFGDPTDKPVVGDWNGDGYDTPGVVRNGTWYLVNSDTTGKADVTFGFGDGADRPAAWS